MMKSKIIVTSLLLLMALGATSCRQKRISYTNMIKRESAEIQAFMDKKGFTIIDKLPTDLKMQPNQFYEIKNDANVGLGVFINVLTPGSDLKDMAVSMETSVSARFSYTAIGDRMIGGPKQFSNIGPTESDKPAATFVYQANINTDLQQGSFSAAPNSTAGEEGMSQYVCNAMMLALKHVPLGSTIQMITSFREGPAFTFQASSSFANENEVGVALYYDKLAFTRKQ
ncbi:MAG: DUF4827 family protein [Bacteroidales bacterium]|uniref:DUF4827 family protein n=1 Tax=Porphyromonas sp. TaxID=1924944 RepID=UPI0029784748|nr:DUF4827 family protein [Porphyromonas sp.]MDD7437343.1 DUF4827 family protein [Bacteroidales bacterium]MDY3066674.1 DUF4827 family protein [Porphyromonas sp.]